LSFVWFGNAFILRKVVGIDQVFQLYLFKILWLHNIVWHQLTLINIQSEIGKYLNIQSMVRLSTTFRSWTVPEWRHPSPDGRI